MPPLQHYLLTNFNVNREDHLADASGGPVRTEEWLGHRFELFERYCLPSVLGQSCEDFVWLVRWDDTGTPEPYRQRLLDHAEAMPKLQLVSENTAFWRAIHHRAGGRRNRVITTRLDNDDALHRDAMGIVQDAAGEEFEFLNLTSGLCHHHPGGPTLRVEDPTSPFLSLVETIHHAPPLTAVCISHVEAARVAPVRQLQTDPAWLQVIHGRNLVNRLRGDPYPDADLPRDFSVAPGP